MRPFARLLACLLLVVVPFQPASAAPLTPEQRLASQLLQAAGHLVAQDQLTVDAIEAAGLLVKEAVELNPSSADAWRMLLDLAATAEDHRLSRRAVERLIELEPHNEVLRLKWANNYVDRHHTADERIAAYRELLTPARRDELGPAVASRLALDLALLERRRGNNAAFTEWLSEAVALDSSNRAAAAVAAGYFRYHVDDAFAEAELLVALLLADPFDVTAQDMLAAHLLAHGAYAAAERIYMLSVEAHQAMRAMPPDELVGYLAVAQWGKGDAEAALRTIRNRQREANLLLRQQLLRDAPELSSLERARRTAPLAPALSTLRAAIHNRLGSELAEDHLQQVIESYEARIEQLRDNPDQTEEAIAGQKLELAWVILWLHGSVGVAEQYFQQVADQHDLNEATRARFEGWKLLRQGDAEAALAILEPHAQRDPTVALGRAEALIELGRTRDGARAMLEIARRQPGTMLGVWATYALWDVLGQRAPIAGDVAADMNELVASIPNVLDRFAQEPTTAVSMRLVPSKSTYQPYEPLIVNIEITNHAPFPLAISPDGPIRSQVALTATAELARARRVRQIPPMVVDIDRRLRLMPRERMVVPVDLRHTVLGRVLDVQPLPGAILRVKGVLNFLVTPQQAILPGLLGSERETPPFRVDGFRITGQWLDVAMAELSQEGGGRDLPRLASLSHIAGATVAPEADRRERQMISDARTLLAEVYAKLDPASQAWLLTVMPKSDALDPLLAMARRSENRLVRMVYLVYHTENARDPMFAAAERSGDERLQRLAKLVAAAHARRGTDDDLDFGLSLDD